MKEIKDSNSGTNVQSSTNVVTGVTNESLKSFKDYYGSKFNRDFSLFFEMQENRKNPKEPKWVLSCTPHSNPSRQGVKFDESKKEKDMFAAAVFFHTLYFQAVGVACGYNAMMTFLKVTDWPLINCALGGTMSPIIILQDSELAHKWESDEQKNFFVAIGKYMYNDIKERIASTYADTALKEVGMLYNAINVHDDEIRSVYESHTDEYVNLCSTDEELSCTPMLLPMDSEFWDAKPCIRKRNENICEEVRRQGERIPQWARVANGFRRSLERNCGNIMEPPVTHETFAEYFYCRFPSDLRKYYHVRNDFDDGSYLYVQEMCSAFDNVKRRWMECDGVNHFCMFSASVYFVAMFSQVIGRLYGWPQMLNFLRITDWPMLCCGAGGVMHPIQTMWESELLPYGMESIYDDVMNIAQDCLIQEYVQFLKGKSLDLEHNSTYKKLCEVVNIRQVLNEVTDQISQYRNWLKNHDLEYNRCYITFPTVLNNPETVNDSVVSYLSQFQETVPNWLFKCERGGNVTFSDVMSGRVGYYAGSGFDGSLMKVGSKSKSIHSFIYVDYGIPKEKLIKHLEEKGSILGYHSIRRIEWDEKDLMPNGTYPLELHRKPLYNSNPNWFVDPKETPYCFTEIMQRDHDKNDDWGTEMFAITFLFADGISTYYELFCKEYKKAPWLMLLQDHGFGGNYDRFGKGGMLDEIIMTSGKRPDYVLCAEDGTTIWDGYEKIDNLPPVLDGMHKSSRSLYRNTIGWTEMPLKRRLGEAEPEEITFMLDEE